MNKKGLIASPEIRPIEINETLLQLNEEKLSNYLVEVAYSARSFIPQSGYK